MFCLLAPVLIHPSPDLRPVLSGRLRPACVAVRQAMARSGMGLEFAYLPFLFEGTPMALSSRLRPDGVTVIELDRDSSRHPHRVVTAAVHRQALARTVGGR